MSFFRLQMSVNQQWEWSRFHIIDRLIDGAAHRHAGETKLFPCEQSFTLTLPESFSNYSSHQNAANAPYENDLLEKDDFSSRKDDYS